ncbi:hypothetical protein CYMTET_17755 [Cymbomonas tetramitiformis]|uniref:Uncharacterized protein n=1 Tax=Cymbomonas tetramitiformis TaxID=36881 RepID=A0AAE0L6Z8_9CHLO|nr:hypothetical protein CYMTET_17755 [Cymbomonas tetramitiformis]
MSGRSFAKRSRRCAIAGWGQRHELGESQYTELAVWMPAETLWASMHSNYMPDAKEPHDFCARERRKSWFLASEETRRMCVASLLLADTADYRRPGCGH